LVRIKGRSLWKLRITDTGIKLKEAQQHVVAIRDAGEGGGKCWGQEVSVSQRLVGNS